MPMKMLLVSLLLQMSSVLFAAQPPRISIPTSPHASIPVENQLPAATAEQAAFWKKALAELKAEKPTAPVMPLRSAEEFTRVFCKLHVLARRRDLTVDEVALQGNLVYQSYNKYLATLVPTFKKDMEAIEAGLMWKENLWLHETLRDKKISEISKSHPPFPYQ
jgi:hypothetical protein